MSLETFGWILMALGLLLIVYGYCRASARDEWHRIRWERWNGGGVITFPSGTSLEEVESFRALFDSKARVYGGVYDWEREEGEL